MANQSPLIAIPRKTTVDADWAAPIRSTIAHSFGESPDSYAEEISNLARCRQDAVRGAGSDTTGRDLLYKYFGQLELLELRFAEVKVSFSWNDAFTTKQTTQTSLAFEKASVIHLLAAVLSSVAQTQSRADPEGLKRAYFNCRATAGMLTYINENFLHAPSTDLSRDVVHLLINLSLAQSTEVFMEKLVEEKKSANLIARTANQAASMYIQLTDQIHEFQGKGVFDRNWVRVIEAKAKYFGSMAQYQRGLSDAAAGKYGVSLVRFKAAHELAKEASRIGAGFNYAFTPALSPTLPNDAGTALAELTAAHATVVQEAKDQAVKDNDLIYHDILPSEASLPPIEKLQAAAPVTIQEIYGQPEVSKLIGPDIFARLIPLAVHESASVYSEEKAKLVRAEVERVELNETEYRSALSHLHMPGAVQEWQRLASGDEQESDLSPRIIQAAEDVSGSSSTGSKVQQLEGQRVNCERQLTELTAQLDTESRECERARAKYAPNFTQPPSGPQTGHLRQTISSNLQALSSAHNNNEQLVSLWREIEPDLAVLQSGSDRLRAVAKDIALGQEKKQDVPSGISLLDLQDEETPKTGLDKKEQDELKAFAQEAHGKLERLRKVRKERDEVLKDLKEKIQNDDVSNLLLLNRRTQNVEPQLFASELEKFRPFQSRLGAATSAVKTLVGELEGITQQVSRIKGVRDHQRSAKGQNKRIRDWEERLVTASQRHGEVVDGVAKAAAFYQSIDDVIADIKREVTSFVGKRDSERSRMVSDMETRNRLGSSSPAASLDGQLAGLNLNNKPYAPPKPTSPNPYDFDSMSSMSAFSTGTQPPPPPRPSQTTYPSFPAAPTSPPATSPPPQAPYHPPSGASPFPPPPPQPYRQTSSSYQSPTQAYPPPPPSRPSYQPPQPSQQSYSPSQYSAPSSQPPSAPSQQYSAPPPSSQYSSPPPSSQQYPSPPSQQQYTPSQYSSYSSSYPTPPQAPPQRQSSYTQQPSYQPPSQYGQSQYQPPQQPQQQYQPPQQYNQPPPGGYQPPGQYGGYQPPPGSGQPQGQGQQYGGYQYR